VSTTVLNDFPKKTRGTFRLRDDDNASSAQKLEFAKKLVKEIAESASLTILLDCTMSGSGWLLIWWPASEPRHEASDEIIN